MSIAIAFAMSLHTTVLAHERAARNAAEKAREAAAAVSVLMCDSTSYTAPRKKRNRDGDLISETSEFGEENDFMQTDAFENPGAFDGDPVVNLETALVVSVPPTSWEHEMQFYVDEMIASLTLRIETRLMYQKQLKRIFRRQHCLWEWTGLGQHIPVLFAEDVKKMNSVLHQGLSKWSRSIPTCYKKVANYDSNGSGLAAVKHFYLFARTRGIISQ